MTAWSHVGLLYPKFKMLYLLKKVYLINIYTNTTHILDMPRWHQHQQQMYHNENTKICMFIQY